MSFVSHDVYGAGTTWRSDSSHACHNSPANCFHDLLCQVIVIVGWSNLYKRHSLSWPSPTTSCYRSETKINTQNRLTIWSFSTFPEVLFRPYLKRVTDFQIRLRHGPIFQDWCYFSPRFLALLNFWNFIMYSFNTRFWANWFRKHMSRFVNTCHIS